MATILQQSSFVRKFEVTAALLKRLAYQGLTQNTSSQTCKIPRRKPSRYFKVVHNIVIGVAINSAKVTLLSSRPYNIRFFITSH